MGQLADTLMQISRQKEVREARRSSDRFRDKHTKPYQDAQAKYYKALAMRQNVETLNLLDDELKEFKTAGAKLEAEKLKLTLDAIKRLPEDDPVRLQALTGIKQNQDLRDLNDTVRTILANRTLQLREASAGLSQSRDNYMRLFENSAEGDRTRAYFRDRGILDETIQDAIEGTFDRKVPEKVDPKGFLERIMDTLYSEPGIVEPRQVEPEQRKPSGEPSARAPSKLAPTKKAEMAPAKKEEKPSALDMDKLGPILEKADENNIKWKDIQAGVQELVQSFPNLSEDDKISAYDKLAEGFTVDELVDYYKSLRE